jgi:stalled ribosome rescue protein Dom34
LNDAHHAVVWIDHSEAKIFRFGTNDDPEIDIHSHTSLQRLHHSKTGWEAGGNPPDDTEFFKRIMDAIDNIGGTLITGPGNAKTALKAFLDHARPESASHVFAIETMQQPDADALLELGRRYFRGAAPRQSHSPIATVAESPSNRTKIKELV